MTRRASLPGAAESFRTTSAAEPEPRPPVPHPGAGTVASLHGAGTAGFDRPHREASTGVRAVRATHRIRTVSDRAPSGRERHDEKVTVYCSPEELLDLESARLDLRGEHGLAVDRGRIVREALVLADPRGEGRRLDPRAAAAGIVIVPATARVRVDVV